MSLIILQALYFMLPAYMANMAPVAVKRIPFGDVPLDKGSSWRGKRILGDHKTARGLVAGIIFAVLTVLAQRALVDVAPIFAQISLLPYSELWPEILILLGILYGLGALGGDAIKSFFKRRIGIAPGKNWIPFDQLDFVIGSLALVGLVYFPPAPHIIVILILSPLLHALVNITDFLP